MNARLSCGPRETTVDVPTPQAPRSSSKVSLEPDADLGGGVRWRSAASPLLPDQAFLNPQLILGVNAMIAASVPTLPQRPPMSILCETSLVSIGEDSSYTWRRYQHDGYLREDTRSNIYYSAPASPNHQSHVPAALIQSCSNSKGSVPSTSPAPLLTQELLDVGEEALSAYDAMRLKSAPSPPEIFVPNPFSTLSAEELEDYYAAAVDVQNALDLRKSVVKADIGDTLQDIMPKLSLYLRDDAVLDVVSHELRLIIETCSNRSIELNMYGLEYRRHFLPQHNQSILEKHRGLFSALRNALVEKNYAQEVAHIFFEDPSAVVENRLPPFGTSQR
ncbi:hypothetical protein BDN70DRAFT_902130 [Pholiota conissans]|uniref:Uncharacterized protein n=1 Tax=Pholiota conissans TaxID=109636 RepID=A0A9P5YKG2_9AGAR|nr:hypothetical protein BDN70DRAFT_902130 [Pholiota conissans]